MKRLILIPLLFLVVACGAVPEEPTKDHDSGPTNGELFEQDCADASGTFTRIRLTSETATYTCTLNGIIIAQENYHL